MNLRTSFTALALAVGAIFLMTAATVSATNIEAPAGTIYTGPVNAEAEGHVVLDNPIAKIECASSIEGEIESHGEGVTAKGKISALSFTGCTNSWHVTVVGTGSLEVHHTSGSNGTVTSSGATVEATRFGITCRYATSNTSIGTLAGGAPATLSIEAAIPFHSGSGLCGSSATTWTGSYKITSPAELLVNQGVQVPTPIIVSPHKFEENKPLQPVKIEDKEVKVLPYRVGSVSLLNKGGTWTLEEVGKCENVEVLAKGPICEVQVKCGPGKGKAWILIFVEWGAKPERLLFPPTVVTCE